MDIDQVHQKFEGRAVFRAVKDEVAGFVEDAAAIAPEKLAGNGDQAFIGLPLEEEAVGEVKFIFQSSDLEQIGKGAGGRQHPRRHRDRCDNRAGRHRRTRGGRRGGSDNGWR